jgi:hypothetical protein
MILFGKRYCGYHFFDAKDLDWNMTTGNPEHWETVIDFPREFAVEPEVFLSISAISSKGDNKISLFASDITVRDFKLNITVWGGTEISGIGINWIATDEWLQTMQATGGEIVVDEEKERVRKMLARIESEKRS